MKACSISGCERAHYARGWCKKHYDRWRTHGDPESSLIDREHTDLCTVDSCGESYYAKGYCRAHYSRSWRYGHPTAGGPRQNEPLAVRLDRYTALGDGCWEWRGARDRLGYGRLNVDGVPQLAHRLLYEELRGPIPYDLELDHLCRNPSCVRPDHLEAVTHAENLRRGREALLR